MTIEELLYPRNAPVGSEPPGRSLDGSSAAG
jgi:hypothetical protein